MPKQMSKRQATPSIASISYWRKFAVHRVLYLGLAILFGASAVAYFGSSQGRGGNSGTERNTAVIVTVNGEPIRREVYERQWQATQERNRMMRQLGAGAGQPPTTAISEVQDQGRILYYMIQNAILTNAAKKRGITVSDADVEQQIARTKITGKDGKPESDDELDKRLQESDGMTLAQYRAMAKEGLLPQALDESIAAKEKVTEEDLLKTYDKIKARHILITVTNTKMPMPGALPDAQAKQRAEKVLALLKGGADFAKTADEFSQDPGNQRTDLDPKSKKPVTRKNGGLLNADVGGWYQRGGSGDDGKVFDEEAFKVQKGQMSDIIKTPRGYEIVKVEDYKRELPQDYAKNKTDLLKQEKMQRAAKPIQAMKDAEIKAAKIEWQDPSLEWRYDFAKQSPMMMNPMAPSQENTDDAFLAKMRKYVEKNKEDGAALLVLGQTLDKKLMYAMPKRVQLKPGDHDKLVDEAISAYDLALKKTEDQQARFRLADLYQMRNRNDDAAKQLEKVMHLLSFDDDPKSRFTYSQLASRFTMLGKPDLGFKAQQKFQQLTEKFNEQQKKEAEARKKADEQRKKDEAKKAAAKPGAKPDAKAPAVGTINVAPSGAAPGVRVEAKAPPTDAKKPAADKKPAVDDKKPAADDKKPAAGK